VRKYLLAGTALVAMTNFAHADDSMTMAGITLYGTVDMGVAYQTHGVPTGDTPASIESLISKNEGKSRFNAAPNGLSQSKIGLKGEETLVDGWSGVFKLETGFNPYSGQLGDGLKSLTQNNGVPLAQQTANGDSSRAGQPFQGGAYAGLSNKTFGTLTFGRQNSLMLDNIGKYDPQAGSYNFSPIGYSGVASGSGDTENARVDNSVKYANAIGPVRVSGLYKFGGVSGNQGSSVQAGLGTNLGALSVDTNFAHVKDAISAGILGTTSASAGLNTLSGTVSDNTSYAVMASYDFGQPKLFAGYEYISFANPSVPLPTNFVDIGGYVLSSVNNTAYANHKILQISWGGVKYAVSPNFDLAGAYYHYDQNSYKGNGCSNSSAASCSGQLNAASLVADYHLSKRLDVYGGAMWSSVANGLASGYLHSATIDPAVGVRFSF